MMLPRRRTTVCREGWYYLAVILALFGLALAREMNLLLLLAALVCGPLFLSWPLVRVTLGGLAVRRRMPREVCAGDTLVVNLELTNARRAMASWALAVEDQIVRDGGGEEPIRPVVYFPHVRAGERADRVYRGRLVQRGRYRFGPLRISTRFPLGFLRCTVTAGTVDTLIVFPRLGRLKPGWPLRRSEAFEGTQRRRRRHSRVSGDFYGVREWQQGDSRRWIHWRSSARHGSLVVRHFEQHHNRDVALLVDLWQPGNAGPEDLENTELAVSFAATVMAEVCRRGGAELLIALPTSPPQCIAGPASMPLMEEIMGRLALVQASSRESLTELLEVALPRIHRGADVFLVSTRSVDLADPDRFAGFWTDPARRARLARIQVINTASPELSEYFQSE